MTAGATLEPGSGSAGGGSVPSALCATSLQAPHADPFCRRLTAYLSEALDRPIRFADDQPWQARQSLLDEGKVDIAWICGLPYTLRRDRAVPAVTLLAAPVMDGARYRDRPIYFSDVVVRRSSRWRTFADLRDARWAYNEPTSHSGYNLTRFELARGGYRSGFFACTVEAGSHEAALELLCGGEVDATALDSTVLDAMVGARPTLAETLRVVTTWGPSPIPPWVVASHVDEHTLGVLRNLLASLHLDPAGRDVLRAGRTSRFASVEDADYDVIRQMARVARGVTL